ncbi:MAG: TlpA family protein disulfide reductase [Myxococcales bacterium]|nr:MAG: TlpA family protein disulfide reductase [Myxococcales bacterium]
MKRLTIFAAVFVAVLAAGCDSESRPSEPVRQRVDAVKSTVPQNDIPANWCDRLYLPPTQGPLVSLPPLDPARRLASGKFVWLNFWATWCKPCVKEMPLLARWQTLLTGEGVPFEVLYLSVDEAPAELSAWLKAHPEIPAGQAARLSKVDDLTTWLAPFSLGEASVPIHALIGPDGRVRCVRAGSLVEGDLRTVRALAR